MSCRELTTLNEQVQNEFWLSDEMNTRPRFGLMCPVNVIQVTLEVVRSANVAPFASVNLVVATLHRGERDTCRVVAKD